MEHSQFEIDKCFFTATGKWKCTDKGTRVIVAIKLDELDESLYKGPPYAIVEYVFDEYDFGGCRFEPFEE